MKYYKTFKELPPQFQKTLLSVLLFIYTAENRNNPAVEAMAKVNSKKQTAKQWRFYKYLKMVKADKLRVKNGLDPYYIIAPK